MHNESDGIRYGCGRSDEVAATLSYGSKGLQGHNPALFYDEGPVQVITLTWPIPS
jgi:hypothetical protein